MDINWKSGNMAFLANTTHLINRKSTGLIEKNFLAHDDGQTPPAFFCHIYKNRHGR